MEDPNLQTNPFARLMQVTWPLVRAFRVDVRVSWTVLLWPFLFALSFSRWMTWPEALGWGAACTLALFTTTWTHEMGHIAAARRCGIDTRTISLSGLGGLAHLDAPAQSPRDEIRIALAGPATHLAWMAVVFPLTWVLEPTPGTRWHGMLEGFAWLQLTMMVFNLLPVYPMDGGRTLRGVLSLRTHANRASFHTATVGFAGNGLYVLLGVLAIVGVTFGLPVASHTGPLLACIGIVGIQACRRLRMEARYGEVYGAPDAFQRTLLESQAAVRTMDDEEAAERERRRAARDERARLQETVDRLLDRINEAGGIEKLSARERRELERASQALARGD